MDSSRQERGGRARFYFAVGLASLLWGLANGLNFGIINQNTYLLHGIRLAHPEYWAKDWLATRTVDYHWLFSHVTSWLIVLDPAGWIFGWLNVISILLGGLSIFAIVSGLEGRKTAFAATLLVIGLLAAVHTQSVAGSYLFYNYFQPSNIGVLGFLAALVFFCRRQFLWSGFALACGGLFHANFLILGFPVLFIAHILVSGGIRFAPLLRQFIFPLAALLVFVPVMIQLAFAEGSGQAQHILFQIRSPHHYQPLFFYKEFMPFLGWGLLSLPARWWRRADCPATAAARALLISQLAIVLLGTLTCVIFLPSVSQLYVWRLAPVAVLFFLIFGVRWLLVAPDRMTEIARWQIAAILSGSFLLCFYYLYYFQYRLPICLSICLLLIAGLRLVGQRALNDRTRLARARVVLAVVVFSVSLVWPLKSFRANSTLLSGLPLAEQALYDWARTTNLDAMFLVSPGMHRFRLHARRAIVVDWKSTPIVATDIQEWYRRITDISGDTNVRDPLAAEVGYEGIDADRLDFLAEKYELNYVVFRREVPESLKGRGRVAFSNGKYVALCLD